MNVKTLEFYWSLLIAAGLVLAGCEQRSAPASAKAEAPVEVTTVIPHRGEIYRTITLPGEVHPLYQVTLFAKVPGYLKTLTVDKGDSVKAGDLIADIEVPELQADKVRHEAEVELATAEFNRISGMTSNTMTDEAKRELAVAKGRLSLAKANLEYTTTMLSYTRITAPFAGIVTKRFVDPGAFIPAPNAADTPEAAAIINLTDFKTLRMQIPVPETESPHIVKGLPVEFVTDDLPGRRFAGTVTRYYYALNEKTKTMLTEIEMPNPNLELRPGMLFQARIRLERKVDALLVPVAALVKEKSSAYVFMVVSGTAKKVAVLTGFNDGTHVEIVEGIKPGDAVVSAGLQALRDGQIVKARVAK
jgi:membrane fusion protein (multidrug efflux system)